jgi:hypothetical protein
MTTNLCLRCGQFFDPARPHVCGLLGDETARRLEERLDAFERRLSALEFEALRLNALEVSGVKAPRPAVGACGEQAPVAADDVGASAPPDGNPPGKPPRFDRKGYYRQYMRAWRRRQTTLRRERHGGA